MIDSKSNMPPPFSYERELFLYDSVQQSLCSLVLDAINNNLDINVNLLSEGNELLEEMDSEPNIKEIAEIVNNLNKQLFQHAMRMNAYKCRCGRENREEIKLS